MAADRTWADEVICTINLRVVDLEAQGLENFLEWQGKLSMALEQVGWGIVGNEVPPG